MRDGQYSLVNFLFVVSLLTVPPCAQLFVKLGRRVCPMHHEVGATVYSCVVVQLALVQHRHCVMHLHLHYYNRGSIEMWLRFFAI